MYRDYHPKGVEFYFIYKQLAHPELAGNYVQPITLSERLAHAKEAERRLGASIPWLVDAMDNRLKHALGDRANSEFMIDPEGRIVRKRAWSHPAQIRRDLEQLVGPVANPTREEDVHLKFVLPSKEPAPRGVLPCVDRSHMDAIVTIPTVDPQQNPFFAKLRAEADARLISTGAGELYLGFHLDPLYGAHWNNLTKPLTVQLDVPDTVQVDATHLEAPAVAAASDTDPREFVLQVLAWNKNQRIRVTVTYYVCVGESTCHRVQQHYEVRRKFDPDGGRARGDGAGFWEYESFADKAFEYDKNGDGRLQRDEVQGLILPHFGEFDTNQDGWLDRVEIRQVVDWLNRHHGPTAQP